MARRGAAPAVASLFVVAVAAAGCSLLFPGAGFDGDFPSSSPIASFSKGTATIAIDGGETVTLDVLMDGSGIDSFFGSRVRWSNAGGWNLTLSGAGAQVGGGLGGESAYLTMDRIADGKHLTTYDPTRCIVDVGVADATAIRGTATCKGVEWYDALSLPIGPGEPSEDPDEEKFDAEITFEATP